MNRPNKAVPRAISRMGRPLARSQRSRSRNSIPPEGTGLAECPRRRWYGSAGRGGGCRLKDETLLANPLDLEVERRHPASQPGDVDPQGVVTPGTRRPGPLAQLGL